MLAGMVLGSIVAFILMHKFYASAIAAGVGAVLSWIGLIHASEVAWAAQPEVALGYAMLGNRAGRLRLLPAQRRGAGGGAGGQRAGDGGLTPTSPTMPGPSRRRPTRAPARRRPA